MKNIKPLWPQALPIETYCELYNDSVTAIDYRVKQGYWKIGVHLTKPDGIKCRWVNIQAVEQWALENVNSQRA